MKYPKEQLFIPEQVQYAPILRSFSTTSVEESPTRYLALYLADIQISAYKDAQNSVQGLPVYIEGLGLSEQQIGGTLVYIVSTKLYGGAEGISRKYYFPGLVLTLSFANNEAENKFKDIGSQMLSTFEFFD